jgi:peptidyl-prolyl cis-trans isomerase SurA
MIRKTIPTLTTLLILSSGITVSAATNAAMSAIDGRVENGIVAEVEGRIITVGDVRRRLEPLLPQIAAGVSSQEEFEQQIALIEDEIIQALVDEVLIVRDFYSDEKRRIPNSIVDNELQERLVNEFDDDRAKFLAYLKSIGKTRAEYRQMIQDDIVVSWMRGQNRKSQSIVSPVKIENYYTENRDKYFQPDGIHLRLILLKQIADENQSILDQTAETIMARLRNGADFAALAREFSQDSRKAQGGDWDWIARNDLREELANAAFALNEGEFSEPIRIGKEIFILKDEEKRVAGIQPLEEVREEIESTLASQMQRESQERWLERLRRNAYVRYFD